MPLPSPKEDARGFLAETDREARQRLIEERAKLVGLQGAIQHAIAEYDRLIGGARYPYADNGFDAKYAAMCRAAEAVFNVEELGHMADAYEPQMQEARVVSVIDQRGCGPSYYAEAAE